ncbi:hypothetical protein APE_1902.1 [Aeropyrum pernix K1]|uniref:Uncharacterized protein n=1 Tax=Aeropyrum pernix (strain ATCC 700893 / DSM 11879 / JCM 9820 / NBRC 100138 / K1) TaxID=272557 RepID=Q9YAP1_AERPE|nr:hypothetical protein [Aeropyrum pernix]BAA80907.2 hypothetical protein APE_1902.1 [Aeropyrum pernix K1]
MGDAGGGDKELRELLESLREVVLELRSVLLESRNPLRKVMVNEGEEDGGEAGGEDLAPVSASPNIFTPNIHVGVAHNPGQATTSPKSTSESSVGGKNKDLWDANTPDVGTPPQENFRRAEHANGFKGFEDSSIHPANFRETRLNELASGKAGPTPSMADLVEVAKTLWSLGESMPPEVFEKIIDLLEASGQLDERRREVVRKYIELMREARKLGLTPEEQIVAVYSIARSLGIRDEEFEKEVFRLVVRLLGGRRWENQQ